MSLWHHPRARSYGIAVLVVAVAAGVQYVFNRIVGPAFPFSVFYTAMMLSAWYGGLGPGLVTTAFSVVVAGGFFIPTTALAPLPSSPTARLALMACGGLIIAVLSESLHRARGRAARTTETLAAKHRELEREMAARQEADEVRARLAGIVESSEDAIISETMDGTITSWNAGAERLYGYAASEAVGKSMAMIIPPEQPGELAAILDRLRRGERIQHYETVRLNKRGERIDVSIRLSPMRNAVGTVIGASVVARDIVERKRIENEVRRLNTALQAADRRKDEFLAMLAHELRNPLAPIRNAVYALARLGPPTPQAQRLHQMIERQTVHMTRLVDDLLDVSRITRRMVALHPERVALADVIAHAVDTVQPLIDQQGHQLTISLGTPPIELHGDPARLAQVFANLLTNAAKFTPPRGHITLTAERSADHAVVRVRDTGIGIAAALLPNVFDMFVQHSVANDRQEGGLGIGLTLVKLLTEMHGGTVSASSAGLGRGSEFIVTLPALAARLGVEAASAPRESPPPVVPLRILLVEDNLDAAESFAMLLQLDGHQVHIAHDGLSALRAAETFTADVAFLDIGLPNMDGYELAGYLRKMPSFQSAVLVALTGYAQDHDKAQARQAGFDHHLTKPVDPERVRALLAQLGSAAEPGDRPSRQLH